MKRERTVARRLWLWLLGVMGILLAIQCVTYTPAARLRYLADESGLPIEGLEVVAVWQLRSGNLAGSLGAGVIRIRKAHSDGQGYVDIGAATIFHAPVFPFSFHFRDLKYLPMVYAEDHLHEAHIAASGLRRGSGRVARSMLSLQDAALDGETLHLGKQIDADRHEMVRQQIQQAYFSCRQSRLCTEVES